MIIDEIGINERVILFMQGDSDAIRVMTAETNHANPRDIAHIVNQCFVQVRTSGTKYIVGDGVRYVTSLLRSGEARTTAGVGFLAAAKAFGSLEVGAIITSGSLTAIGYAVGAVLAAGAVGYGFGTLINEFVVDPLVWK